MVTGGGTENPGAILKAQLVTVEVIKVAIKVVTANGMMEAAIAVTAIKGVAQTSHQTA